jgi:hypothetical protein
MRVRAGLSGSWLSPDSASAGGLQPMMVHSNSAHSPVAAPKPIDRLVVVKFDRDQLPREQSVAPKNG